MGRRQEGVAGAGINHEEPGRSYSRGPVFSPEGNWKPQKDIKEEESLLGFHSRSITLAQCRRRIERESKVAILELAEPSVLL